MRPGCLILGCTHYPLLTGAIGKLMGADAVLVSSARAAALEVRQRLCKTAVGAGGAHVRADQGSLRCFTTGDPGRFARLGRRFSGEELANVSHVGTDELDGVAVGPDEVVECNDA